MPPRLSMRKFDGAKGPFTHQKSRNLSTKRTGLCLTLIFSPCRLATFDPDLGACMVLLVLIPHMLLCRHSHHRNRSAIRVSPRISSCWTQNACAAG